MNTADTTPPVVSGLSVTPSDSGDALLTFTTDEPAACHVEYGVTATYGQIASSGDYSNDHSISLSGLQPGQTYYLEATAYDAAGNTAGTPVLTFRTTPTDQSSQVVIIEQGSERTAADPAGNSVVITTVHYDGKVPHTEADEYVEIVNTGSASVNLKGWVLKDVADGKPSFTFPSYTLAPGKTVRVYTNEVHSEYGGFTFGSSAAVWNNSDADTAGLYDADGALVSQKSY